jgi:hypothetical protein
MSQRTPPAVATWLTERLGPVRYRESLTGDLLEQFHRGRSEVWYWRQVLMAILLAGLQLPRSVLAIPKVKFVLRLLIEYLILALGVGTITWAASTSKTPCAIVICVHTKVP